MKRVRFFYQKMKTIRLWIHHLRVMNLLNLSMLKDLYLQELLKVFVHDEYGWSLMSVLIVAKLYRAFHLYLC